MADTSASAQHQYGSQSAVMVFVTGFMHQASFAAGNRCYDRHRSVSPVGDLGYLAVAQIAQAWLSSP